MIRAAEARAARLRRHVRVRKKVEGSAVRPRLSVFRSLSHIYAQIIDDATGRTLVSASTIEPEVRTQVAGKTKTQQAGLVGKLVGERAKSQGIETVVFDRGGFDYHGRVKALAEAARETGLKF